MAQATPHRSAGNRGFDAVAVNNFEHASDDYAKIRDWYVDLFGLTIH